MKRKPPPTIYTCISEPNGSGDVVIRWSCDPDALDSAPFAYHPPPGSVSDSRVVFVYDDDPCEYGWAVSCRCAEGNDDVAGLYAGDMYKGSQTKDNGAAGARWLVEGEER
jgi:hypothetical protein